MKRNSVIFCVALALLVLLAALSLATGKFPITFGGILETGSLESKVFFTLRLPRTLIALLGGFCLGLCGFVFQTVFRNPLASPDIIGVASGASVGAATGILFFSSVISVTLSAFVGALLTMALALALSALDKASRGGTIVLAGIAVHSLAQTLLMVLKLMADPEKELASIEYWIMGGLSDVTSYSISYNVLICVVSLILLFLFHRQIILLSAEEGEAKSLGVRVSILRIFVLLLGALAVASVISLTGLISFVGLLAPHIARKILGHNKQSTMLLSGISGSIILISADLLARSLSSSELPVSIFTSLIGAPFLIILIVRGRKNV